jgi:hypothetical protein
LRADPRVSNPWCRSKIGPYRRESFVAPGWRAVLDARMFVSPARSWKCHPRMAVAMNAIAPIHDGIEAAAWARVLAEANAWRGNAVHCFAQAEMAVSETLLAMQCAPLGEPRVRLRRLVGQRFEDLRTAIGPDGPFESHCGKAVAVLADFWRFESLRPFLCHGVAKVAIDRRGQWLLVLKVLAFSGGKAERSSLAYEQHEAAAVLVDLKTASRRLCSALQSLRTRIA